MNRDIVRNIDSNQYKYLKRVLSIICFMGALIFGLLNFYLVDSLRNLYADLGIEDLPFFIDTLFNGNLALILSIYFFALGIYYLASSFKEISENIKNIEIKLTIISLFFGFLSIFVIGFLIYYSIFDVQDFV